MNSLAPERERDIQRERESWRPTYVKYTVLYLRREREGARWNSSFLPSLPSPSATHTLHPTILLPPSPLLFFHLAPGWLESVSLPEDGRRRRRDRIERRRRKNPPSFLRLPFQRSEAFCAIFILFPPPPFLHSFRRPLFLFPDPPFLPPCCSIEYRGFFPFCNKEKMGVEKKGGRDGPPPPFLLGLRPQRGSFLAKEYRSPSSAQMNPLLRNQLREIMIFLPGFSALTAFCGISYIGSRGKARDFPSCLPSRALKKRLQSQRLVLPQEIFFPRSPTHTFSPPPLHASSRRRRRRRHLTPPRGGGGGERGTRGGCGMHAAVHVEGNHPKWAPLLW